VSRGRLARIVLVVAPVVVVLVPATAAARVDHCLVPKVQRLTLANARSRLLAYSCRAGKVTHAYSSLVKKGAVISQKPKNGSRLTRGAKVSLVVSRGKRPHRR
jgi:beta-lactam-binding protein with PASTA domain